MSYDFNCGESLKFKICCISLWGTERSINSDLKLIPGCRVSTWPHAATAEVPLAPRAASLRAPARLWTSLLALRRQERVSGPEQPGQFSARAATGAHWSDMRSNRRGRDERHSQIVANDDWHGSLGLFSSESLMGLELVTQLMWFHKCLCWDVYLCSVNVQTHPWKTGRLRVFWHSIE